MDPVEPLSEVELSLTDIIRDLRAQIAQSEPGASELRLRVLDPDLGRSCYAGAPIDVDGRPIPHRPWRTWFDLADRLGLRLRTPRRLDARWLELRFDVLDPRAGWRDAKPEDPREKYGAASGYQRITKLEDPDLILDLDDALDRLKLPDAPRILDLGVNRGDSLALLMGLRPGWARAASFVGVDHSASALDLARARYRELGPRARFIEADLGQLGELELGRFDLVLSIGTLHSPGVDHQAVLGHVVKDLLAARGGVILGVPNCTHLDGEQLYGAKMKNFSQPELSLLIKSVAYYKRFLQQHQRKVYVTGKYYVLVTGAAI